MFPKEVFEGWFTARYLEKPAAVCFLKLMSIHHLLKQQNNSTLLFIKTLQPRAQRCTSQNLVSTLSIKTDRSSSSTLGFFGSQSYTLKDWVRFFFFFFLTLEVKWNMEWCVIKQNLLYLRQLRTLRFYADFKYFTRLVFILFWLNCGRRMEWGLAFSVSIK